MEYELIKEEPIYFFEKNIQYVMQNGSGVIRI